MPTFDREAPERVRARLPTGLPPSPVRCGRVATLLLSIIALLFCRELHSLSQSMVASARGTCQPVCARDGAARRAVQPARCYFVTQYSPGGGDNNSDAPVADIRPGLPVRGTSGSMPVRRAPWPCNARARHTTHAARAVLRGVSNKPPPPAPLWRAGGAETGAVHPGEQPLPSRPK